MVRFLLLGTAFLLTLAACTSSPATPTPTLPPTPTVTAVPVSAEATVLAWFAAFAATDADRLIALHIPEHREFQRDGYESWVAEIRPALAQQESGSESAIEDPELEVLTQTGRETVIEAEGPAVIGGRIIPARWKFRLSKKNDQWLIDGLSGLVPDGMLFRMEIVVSDPQGNPVPGAQVTISTGQTQATDESGMAVFPYIVSRWDWTTSRSLRRAFRPRLLRVPCSDSIRPCFGPDRAYQSRSSWLEQRGIRGRTWRTGRRWT